MLNILVYSDMEATMSKAYNKVYDWKSKHISLMMSIKLITWKTL